MHSKTRSRALFQDSVDGLDFAMRSRLTQARHAAIEAAGRRALVSALDDVDTGGRRHRRRGAGRCALGGFAAGAACEPLADGQSNLEDLELVASSEGSGDAMEMLQDDIDFYDFADKAASPDPAA